MSLNREVGNPSVTEIKEKRNERSIIKEFSLPLYIWRELLLKGMDPHGKLLVNQLGLTVEHFGNTSRSS